MSHKRLAMYLTALLLAHRLLLAAFESASDSIHKGERHPSKAYESKANDTPSLGFRLVQESSLPSAINSSTIQKQLFQYYYFQQKRRDKADKAFHERSQAPYLHPNHHPHNKSTADDDRIIDDDPMTPPDPPNDDDGVNDKGNKEDEGAFSIDLLIYCIVMLILILSTCMKECSRSREADARQRGQGDEENDGNDDETDGEGSEEMEGGRRRRRRRRMTLAERREFIMKHLIVQMIPDPDNDRKMKANEEPGSGNDANADSESDTSESRLNVVQSVMSKVIASMQRTGASTIAVQSSLVPSGDGPSSSNPLTEPLLSHETATGGEDTMLHRESSFTSTNSPDNYYHCCTICMDEYAPGEEICFSKFNRICNHHYHLKCMMSWLLTKRNAERDDACPICRANYLQTSVSMSSTASSRTSSSRRSRRHRRERERTSRRNSGSNNIPFAMFEDEDSLSLALHSV